MPASQADTAETHILAWEGWRFILPVDWNPARLEGTFRQGTLVIADLESVRLDLRWKRLRSLKAVDLRRATGRRSDRLEWQPVSDAHSDFASAMTANTSTGDRLGFLLSRASRRLLFVRITTGTEQPHNRQADRILATVRDISRSDPVLWSIYGFRWSVPAGFTLADHSLSTGRSVLTFRSRRAALTYVRTMLPAGDPTVGSDDSDTINHRGHQVTMRRLPPASLAERLRRWHRWAAEWSCPTSNRRFRVTAAAREARQLVGRAIPHIDCHDSNAGFRPDEA